MSDEIPIASVRFGRTVVVVEHGPLLHQRVDAIVIAANARGMIGGGGSETIRTLGGEEIERETMTRAPLRIGDAVVTGSGLLLRAGVRAIIHAVGSPALGEPARLRDARRALLASLEEADERRLRTIALSPLSAVGENGARLDDEQLGLAFVEDVVGYLRRGTTHLDRVTVVAQFAAHVDPLLAAFAEARRSSWVSPA